MDEIEGFKQYLGVAEEDRLNYLHPPEKTPELFERYLPYAVALDVENRWADRFAGVLAAAAAAGAATAAWYVGNRESQTDWGNFARSCRRQSVEYGGVGIDRAGIERRRIVGIGRRRFVGRRRRRRRRIGLVAASVDVRRPMAATCTLRFFIMRSSAPRRSSYSFALKPFIAARYSATASGSILS